MPLPTRSGQENVCRRGAHVSCDPLPHLPTGPKARTYPGSTRMFGEARLKGADGSLLVQSTMRPEADDD